jgi:hypothetical protein
MHPECAQAGAHQDVVLVEYQLSWDSGKIPCIRFDTVQITVHDPLFMANVRIPSTQFHNIPALAIIFFILAW